MTNDTEAIKRAVALLPYMKDCTWETPGYELVISDLNDVVAALSALAPVAEGKAVIVPVEPTESMIAAGIGVRHLQGTPEAWSMATVNIYRAMIGARG